MKKVILSVIAVLLVLGAFGVFFYLRAQEAVEKMVLGVKNVKMQNVETEIMPKTDVSGEEILGLARYPGAIRTSYLKNDIGSTAVYQVKTPAEEVFKLYQNEIIALGWGLAYSDDEKMIFVKDENKLTLLAKTNKFDITTYQLILEKY